MQKPYRLGLDLGSNSIGWFVVWLERDGERWRASGLGPGGVRIYPDGRDPQSQASNAEARRMARGARRRRDRFLKRRKDLIQALIQHGLMPADEAARKALEPLDPYELRASALERPLPPEHVGRALFHLNQRRGFKSNRKSGDGDDKGAIKQAATKLSQAMEAKDAATLGQFLWERRQRREGVRARNLSTGAKAAYDFYPTRDMLKAEFDAIWDAQAPHHPFMTAEARKIICDRIIFYQRELKEQPVGKCALSPAKEKPEIDPEGYRCPWADPRAQRFRIMQEVSNLAVGFMGRSQRKLTPDEVAAIGLALIHCEQKEYSFDNMRALLKLPDDARFNLEDEKRKGLKSDATAVVLADKKRFGKAWRALPLERQVEIVAQLLSETDEAALVDWLMAEYGLTAEQAEAVADAPLPDGHCRLGLRAIQAILPHMEAGLQYHAAAEAAGYDHAKLPTGEIRDKLPYYGEWLSDAVLGTGDPNDPEEKRYGRLPNPTVHIGLRQLQKIVNALIREHGAPTEIVVEMTRGFKMSPREKDVLLREQRLNQKKNEERAAELEKLGFSPNAGNLLRMRLWEELNPRDPLDRKCPFTGEQISLQMLMSAEVEIEHLIPFSDSWDDSAANKIVCMRYANRAKGNRAPHTAFSSNPTIDGHTYHWEQIAARASSLPRNKRWRFEPDAMKKFEEMGGFLGRQLNETGWLARLAKQYLGAVTDPYSIWVIPGRLTSMIRAKWGLNSLLPDHNYGGVQDRADAFNATMNDLEFAGVKNRADHRHHAIDALVAALTDRSLLYRMANAYDAERDKIEVPPPAAWKDVDALRADLNGRLKTMIVSWKPDHGAQGKLHEDTAYGIVANAPNGKDNLVRRKPLQSLTENEIDCIRDNRLRDLVRSFVDEKKAAGMKLPDALKAFQDEYQDGKDPHIKHGLRRVRLLKSEKPDYLVPVKDRKTGKIYKAYSAGDNHCIEVFETPDGKWRGEAVRVFDANQKNHKPKWRSEFPNAKLVMRVHKGDTLQLEHDGKQKIMIVHRLDASADRFKLAEHNETGKLDKRHEISNDIDPFRWLMASYSTLKAKNARQVKVDELGRIWPMKFTS